MSPSWNFPARAEPSYEGSEPSRAELGHFNFRAETELTKKSQIFFNSFFLQVFISEVLSKKATYKYLVFVVNQIIQTQSDYHIGCSRTKSIFFLCNLFGTYLGNQCRTIFYVKEQEHTLELMKLVLFVASIKAALVNIANLQHSTKVNYLPMYSICSAGIKVPLLELTIRKSFQRPYIT